MKAVIFGAGENTLNFFRKNPASNKIEIVGVVDNDNVKWGEKIEGYIIEPPEEIGKLEFDYIVVTPVDSDDIIAQLGDIYGVERGKIINSRNLIVPAETNLGTVKLQCKNDQCYNIYDLIPQCTIPSNPLEDYYFMNSHNVMYKWWHYFEIYHIFLKKYINTEARILEIGVFNGGSVTMWENYFGRKSTIVGIDINEKCKQYEEGNIHICIGSQADTDFLKNVSGKWGPFDVVIDDGSHMMQHQITTFETLFPLLNENGVYICEDCHTSYMSCYDGGYKKGSTFIEYSKNFIDFVNWQHINEEKQNSDIADVVKACHYYDSMVIVEKKKRGYSVATKFGHE